MQYSRLCSNPRGEGSAQSHFKKTQHNVVLFLCIVLEIQCVRHWAGLGLAQPVWGILVCLPPPCVSSKADFCNHASIGQSSPKNRPVLGLWSSIQQCKLNKLVKVTSVQSSSTNTCCVVLKVQICEVKIPTTFLDTPNILRNPAHRRRCSSQCSIAQDMHYSKIPAEP